jgi:hypothetical protein
MSRYLDRLHRGERWWAAEFIIRTAGLVLLAGCYRIALVARALSAVRSPDQVTTGEFGACLAAFVLLTGGLALTLEGPGLFRHVPIPVRSLGYWKDR